MSELSFNDGVLFGATFVIALIPIVVIAFSLVKGVVKDVRHRKKKRLEAMVEREVKKEGCSCERYVDEQLKGIQNRLGTRIMDLETKVAILSVDKNKE